MNIQLQQKQIYKRLSKSKNKQSAYQSLDNLEQKV